MGNKRGNKFRRRGRLVIRKYVFILIMAILICAYVGGQYICDWEWLTEIVATIIAIIAAVAFWLEYHENKLLNEAQFIADLNEQFIGNENLSNVEWELEKYYAKYKNGELSEEYCTAFEKKYDLNNKERQHLVNYLVHLEGVAALVKNRVLHIQSITDLMSYRYFIAVNNPIVQRLELLEYDDYYQGIWDIYDDWVQVMSKQGATPPMYDENKNYLSKKREQKSCQQKRN